tara:strand:+ start:898 stop:1065 length:168 start_codon:yes stop_codon:yes gene_type:complete
MLTFNKILALSILIYSLGTNHAIGWSIAAAAVYLRKSDDCDHLSPNINCIIKSEK